MFYVAVHSVLVINVVRWSNTFPAATLTEETDTHHQQWGSHSSVTFMACLSSKLKYRRDAHNVCWAGTAVAPHPLGVQRSRCPSTSHTVEKPAWPKSILKISPSSVRVERQSAAHTPVLSALPRPETQLQKLSLWFRKSKKEYRSASSHAVTIVTSLSTALSAKVRITSWDVTSWELSCSTDRLSPQFCLKVKL